MRYIYILFFLLSFNVYSQNQKKHFTFLETGLNYSFLENDNYGDKNFTNGPNIGNVITYGLVYHKNPIINYEFGLSILTKRLLLSDNDFDNSIIPSYSNLSVFLGVSKNIKSNLLAGVGVDLDFVYSEDLSVGSAGFEVLNEASGTPVHFPLVISVQRSFISKKGREKALLLKVKKGFQVVDDFTITNFKDGIQQDQSFRQFKNSSISLIYRYYFGANK
tara:strand:- start:91 stop:747 length:657 start_codon:yes stop_codon:yes gene_type:complete